MLNVSKFINDVEHFQVYLGSEHVSSISASQNRMVSIFALNMNVLNMLSWHVMVDCLNSEKIGHHDELVKKSLMNL